MSFGGDLWELGRRVAACLAIAIAAAAIIATAASADATFGGNPEPEVIPEVTPVEGSCAPYTCTLYWTGPGGSDLVPIPAGGGVGTITSVTLPAMTNPGTMQAVVLSTSVQATRDPAQPTTTCCTVKELSPPFTVPPNQVTTVPLSLHVSATAPANLSVPGSTSTADGVGISVLTATSSAPLRPTENPADVVSFWTPSLAAPSSTFLAPTGPKPEAELQGRFTYVETPGAKPPPATVPGSEGGGAKSGLTLHRGPFRLGRDGRTLTLGTAANPPIVRTRQKLTAPASALAAATAKSKPRGRSKKPVVLGVGRTVVLEGKVATMRLILNRRARTALVAAGSLKATLTILATDFAGESQTLTRRIRVRPAAKAKPERSR